MSSYRSSAARSSARVRWTSGWATDAQVPVSPDGDTAGEIIEIDRTNEIRDGRRDRCSCVIVYPQHEDAGMAARWVLADVTEAAIERDDETAGSCRSCRDGRIVGTGEAFVDKRCRRRGRVARRHERFELADSRRA